MLKLTPYFILFLNFNFLFGQPIVFTPEEKEWIDTHPVVEFGYEPNWEPYEIFFQGEYTGIVGDFVREIERVTGIDMQPIPNLTWKESYEGLKSGTIKMVPSCARSYKREKFLLFTEPYISDPLIIATSLEHEFVGQLTDLYDKKVALPKNYWTIDLLEEHPKIKIIQKENIQECLEAVSYGEVDAYVGSLGVVSYYINNKGFTNLKVAAPTDYENIEISMAFTKDWALFRDICQKVLDGMSIKKRSEIRKSWISVRYEYGLTWTKALSWVAIMTGIFLIGFVIIYFWNKSLRKEIKRRVKIQNSLKQYLNKIKKQDHEKEVLLQEIHHRVKNNLQIITSLLRLQTQTVENNEAIDALNQTTERIRAIGLIHEKIYSGNSLNFISVEDYIHTLSKEILETFGAEKLVKIEVNAQDCFLDLKAVVPIAQILNELITNSVKYAFTATKEPKITIEMLEEEGILMLNYKDNGKWRNSEGKGNFGTSLIEIFTEQLEGKFELKKSNDGTSYSFQFTDYSHSS